MLAAAVAVVIVAVGAAEARELSGARVPDSPAVTAALIPKGSCLVADQVSFAIAANRFTAPSGNCPDVVDSLATTLVLSRGVSPQGGAGQAPRVVAGWEAIFGKARYVWLSGGVAARIPWTPALQSWFASHFRLLGLVTGPGARDAPEGGLYVRR